MGGDTESSSPATVFADFVRRVSDGDSVEFESVVALHPALGAELRERYEEWRSLLARLERTDSISAESPGGAEPAAGQWQAFIEQLRSRGPAWTRYEDLGEIGSGGMGSVRLVRDADARRKLAMKVLRSPAGDSALGKEPGSLVGRFLEEAQITAQLDHPGIVPVHEIGLTADGEVYFTMKYVRGDELGRVFDAVRTCTDGWDLRRAAAVLLRVCEAVAYAHEKGVVHRDLKPSNVMVGRFGEVYVMDWGLALLRPGSPRVEEASNAAHRTSTEALHAGIEGDTDVVASAARALAAASIQGTPSYMPPEQARGDLDAVDIRTDVYALGALLYELLAGVPPYSDGSSQPSARRVLAQVMTGPPAPLSEIAPDAPSALAAIAARCMARSPDERPDSAQEVAAALRAALELQPEPAKAGARGCLGPSALLIGTALAVTVGLAGLL